MLYLFIFLPDSRIPFFSILEQITVFYLMIIFEANSAFSVDRKLYGER